MLGTIHILKTDKFLTFQIVETTVCQAAHKMAKKKRPGCTFQSHKRNCKSRSSSNNNVVTKAIKGAKKKLKDTFKIFFAGDKTDKNL